MEIGAQSWYCWKALDACNFLEGDFGTFRHKVGGVLVEVINAVCETLSCGLFLLFLANFRQSASSASSPDSTSSDNPTYFPIRAIKRLLGFFCSLKSKWVAMPSCTNHTTKPQNVILL